MASATPTLTPIWIPEAASSCCSRRFPALTPCRLCNRKPPAASHASITDPAHKLLRFLTRLLYHLRIVAVFKHGFLNHLADGILGLVTAGDMFARTLQEHFIA